MQLSDLFPDMPKVKIAGVEYTLIYNTRAMLQLEKEFPTKEVDGKTITTQRQITNFLSNAATKGVTAVDILSMLYAGLAHTKKFTSKEALLDLILPRDWEPLAEAIVEGYLKSSMTEEQQEQMHVLMADSKVKKRKKKLRL